MGRMYSAYVEGLAVTVVTDFIVLEAAANSTLIIHEVKFTQDASETSDQLKF